MNEWIGVGSKCDVCVTDLHRGFHASHECPLTSTRKAVQGTNHSSYTSAYAYEQ
jgi:hypothetical protein